MRSLCPQDERFNAANFGFQPVWLILQAIEYGSKHRLEQLHLEELGVSTLTACFVNANRDPKKGEPAKPSDFWYFTSSNQEDKLDGSACDAFFSLVADEKIPSWAVALAPIEKMRASRANGRVTKPRAWMKRGVLLIAPRIENNKLCTPLAIIDGVTGRIPVIDVDSGATKEIVVFNNEKSTFWLQDAEFQLTT